MRVKLVYRVENKEKFAKGNLLSEDENTISIRTDSGAIIEVSRDYVIEFIKYESRGEDYEGKTQKKQEKNHNFNRW